MTHLIDLHNELKAKCAADPAIVAAMVYGSVATGEADAFSDLDVVLFVRDDALNTAKEQRAWLETLAPVYLYFTNEFGVPTVIFPHLLRSEFHFDKASRMADIVAGWQPDVMCFPSLENALLVDKTGDLTAHLQAFIHPPHTNGQTPHAQQAIVDAALNWLVFGLNVLQRGEIVRALELLSMLHRHLLRLARVLENSTVHWATPSRLAEIDLSSEAFARFTACTATANPIALRQAYQNAWLWLNQMVEQLPNTTIPASLSQDIITVLNKQRPPKS